MRTLIAASLFLIALAGCTDADDVWHYQFTQCEDAPWGNVNDAAALESHYGFAFKDVEETTDGGAYASVCGGASDRHLEATPVDGDATKLKADGWKEGPTPQVE
ncbi:MAG: hypothetical protein ACPHID_02035 [Thermoplasmatota archaeon]